MSLPLHIEIVTETYPPEVNGVALTVHSLELGLRRLGHRVALIRTEHAEENQQPTADLVLVEGMPIPRYPGLRFGLPAGRRLQARWQARQPDAVYVATEGPLGWSALRTASRLGIPVATGFHTRFDDYIGRYGAGFLSPWVLAWLRRFHNRGDATLVPTRELQSQLHGLGFRQVQRLARAVDTRQFRPDFRDDALRKAWGMSDADLAVLSVGRLAKEKNLGLTIQAFRALQALNPRARMIFVGDGPLRAELQENIPEAIFSGIQRGGDLARHFASADLFLFPSVSETFGNVTLEAMASGLATVAYDYGATREHLRDGEHGAAVPFDNEQAFIDAAVRIGSHESLHAMGQSARAAVQHLHPDVVARDFAELLGNLRQIRRAA